jgi:glycosyltransferase involved in cell wall biosynthesis
MNILFLEQYSKISGAQLCLLEIIEHLDRNKYMSFVAVPEPGELTAKLGELGIRCFVLPMGSYSQGKKTLADVLKLAVRSLLLIPQVVRVVKKHRIDLVYINAPRALPWGTIAARLAGVPVVWHMHLIIKGYKEKLLTRLLLKLGVDHVICVSRAMARSFITERSRPEQLSIVYNGADLVRYSPAVSGEMFRREFGVEPEQPAIGIVGQISAAKGHETFIRAARIILEKFPRAKFFVVGGSSYDAGGETYINYLRMLARELGIEQNIVFTGRRSDIPDVIAGLDVVVLPSLVAEACPRVVTETLAAGRVMVATDNGAAPEMITHGEDGFLFSPGEVGKLADIVETVLGDLPLREKINHNARLRAERNFNLDHYVGQIISILDGFRR